MTITFSQDSRGSKRRPFKCKSRALPCVSSVMGRSLGSRWSAAAPAFDRDVVFGMSDPSRPQIKSSNVEHTTCTRAAISWPFCASPLALPERVPLVSSLCTVAPRCFSSRSFFSNSTYSGSQVKTVERYSRVLVGCHAVALPARGSRRFAAS